MDILKIELIFMIQKIKTTDLHMDSEHEHISKTKNDQFKTKYMNSVKLSMT